MPQSNRFEGHSERITCLALSPQGHTLISGSRDRSLRIWDVTRERPTHVLTGHDAAIVSVAISSDGQRAVSIGLEPAVYVWDLATSERTRRCPLPFQPERAMTLGLDARLACFGFSKGLQNQVVIWNVDEERAIGDPLDLPAQVLAVALSYDGDSLAVALNNSTTRVFIEIGPHKLQVDRKEIRYIDFQQPKREPGVCLAFSPSGRQLLAGNRDGSAFLTDINRRQIAGELIGRAAPVRAIAFSDDSRLAITGGGPHFEDAAQGNRDYSVRIWDVASRQPLASFDGHEDNVQAIAFHSATRTGYSAGDDLVIRRWQLPSGRPDEPALEH